MEKNTRAKAKAMLREEETARERKTAVGKRLTGRASEGRIRVDETWAMYVDDCV